MMSLVRCKLSVMAKTKSKRFWGGDGAGPAKNVKVTDKFSKNKETNGRKGKKLRKPHRTPAKQKTAPNFVLSTYFSTNTGKVFCGTFFCLLKKI